MPHRRLVPDEEIGNLGECRRERLSARLFRQAGHQSGERRRLVLWLTLVVRAALRGRFRFDTKLKEWVEKDNLITRIGNETCVAIIQYLISMNVL